MPSVFPMTTMASVLAATAGLAINVRLGERP